MKSDLHSFCSARRQQTSRSDSFCNTTAFITQCYIEDCLWLST